jgi:hypothetical protein
MSCTWTIVSIYYNKLQKKCSKIHSMKKFVTGKKTYNPFFSIIMLARCILFAPKQKLYIGHKGTICRITKSMRQ